ncbi:helix-turn-helix transcriptional regulator [Natronomonas sp.]|uniref:helix-turn-helix transcriptional regulator n=1 Tax=Natronomonas sp. TaxID=2184060 RepID=UPI0039894125
MKRGLLVALFSIALLGTVPVATATAGTTQGDLDPDDVLLSISLAEDGDAEWAIEYRVRLDSEEDETAFEEYRADLESTPETYRERLHNRMNATAEDASNATGREMAIRDVSVDASRENLPQEYGVVTYTFEWTNFAAVDGDRLVAGDAVDSLFLDNETELLIEWPNGYALVGVRPDSDDVRENAVLWEGPKRFASGEPRLEVAPESDVDEGGEPTGESGSRLPLVGIALLVVALLGSVGILIRRDIGPFGGDGGETASTVDDEATPPPTAGDLRSNEEQVLRLIEEQGGRMKQADVAEELGWTAAKTSQVTTQLREDGTLDAFRLGRENVLELPGESDT